MLRDASLDLNDRVKTQIEVVWDLGPDNGVTVTDGSVCREASIATRGGIIRDALGHCLLAFSTNFEKCSITRAEIITSVIGLELA
ncbi:hypothetical protein LINPERHAP1_LOCUS12595 [Linum perenne]